MTSIKWEIPENKSHPTPVHSKGSLCCF